MTKHWIGLIPCASIIFMLAASCSSSDGGATGGSSGLGGTAGVSQAGRGGSAEGGAAGTEPGGGSAGEPGAPGPAGAGGTVAEAGSTSSEGGASGSAGAPVDDSPSPATLPGLAFWMDGNAVSYSDLDANYPTPVDSGRIRSIPETPPLTGTWMAPLAESRPVRTKGAVFLKPLETNTGYYLRNTTATIHTDNSTLAISFRPLNGSGGPAQGAIAAPIGNTAQSLGIYFIGSSVGLYFNHTSTVLKRRLPRGAHVTMLVRFTPTGVNVQYDIDGLRTNESIVATIDEETASGFILGYDSGNNAGIYGLVSQVVGVDRALSDDEAGGLMDWLTSRPMPEAFPVTKPLVAILGDSIANGDQVASFQAWPLSMLSELTDTKPELDVQLLNAATNGSGIPKVKNSDYSDVVLPFYSAKRAKNILLVAAGTNDLAGGVNLSDLLDRYYALLDAARATGWKTIACTVLPRSDAGMAKGVVGYEADRKAFNADVVAHWATHADALADVAAITGMGAAGDSDNTTNYSVDKIHPTIAGHALLEPVYRAAVVSQL